MDRPFDERILARAEEVARSYQIVLAREPEVGFLGRTVEMPLAMGDGLTVEECVEQTMQATIAVIATMLELGQQPPAPAREGKRDQQVNIRLTSEEKMRLEEASRREGFRSLSDFLRASGLNRAG